MAGMAVSVTFYSIHLKATCVCVGPSARPDSCFHLPDSAHSTVVNSTVIPLNRPIPHSLALLLILQQSLLLKKGWNKFIMHALVSKV